jgi:glucose-1-phosphate thymidylyltransferase
MLGVCLSGGFGKRMLDSTRVINKHLLPVYSEQGAIPMLYYPINTLIQSGVTNILIITSDEAAGLIIETMGDGSKFGNDIHFTYKIQSMHNPEKPIGIAGALKLSQHFVGENPFAVILGDNFYEDSFCKEFQKFDNTPNLAHVFLKEVVDPERFGVATIKDNKITEIIEKPKNPQSNFAVTGLYLFTNHIFKLLPNLSVSLRGELEVSDLNHYYVKSGEMGHSIIKNYWSDLGIPSSMLRSQEYINKIQFKVPFK